MAAAFHEAALAVDTHVFRVSHRLGLTVGTTPRQVEEDVTKLVPQNKWGDASHWLICTAPDLQGTDAPLRSLPRQPTLPYPADNIRAQAKTRSKMMTRLALLAPVTGFLVACAAFQPAEQDAVARPAAAIEPGRGGVRLSDIDIPGEFQLLLSGRIGAGLGWKVLGY